MPFGDQRKHRCASSNNFSQFGASHSEKNGTLQLGCVILRYRSAPQCRPIEEGEGIRCATIRRKVHMHAVITLLRSVTTLFPTKKMSPLAVTTYNITLFVEQFLQMRTRPRILPDILLAIAHNPVPSHTVVEDILRHE